MSLGEGVDLSHGSAFGVFAAHGGGGLWETTRPGASRRIDWSVAASMMSERSISSPEVGWR